MGYFNATTGQIMPISFDNGLRSVEITPNYVVSVNDSRTYLNAALAGMGMVQLPVFMVKDALARGELVPVLPEWRREPMPIYVVYPQTRHVTNKVRVFVDWLAKMVHSLV
ncbi:transcriptional regulator [compost metagenome]